jgi:hypothetical protein
MQFCTLLQIRIKLYGDNRNLNRVFNPSALAVSYKIFSHSNPNVRVIGQGEAIHRKYKRLKLGGGQGYHRSSD